ncbi:hypothetical protein CJU72_23195, partial [Pseudomonas fragi]
FRAAFAESWPASGLEGATKPVGAGLLAMQAIGSGRSIAVMPSRASPLPQFQGGVCRELASIRP